MEIFYILLVLLLLTRVFGEVAVRLRQPPLVGELVAGIVLGLVVAQRASTFPVLADLTENEVFAALTDLGMFFLMLLAGVEMQPSELAKASGKSFAVAAGGMLIPLFTGLGLGWAFFPASDYKLAQSLFLGTALSITAVPVVVRVLMDMDLQESQMGRMIVSAAIFDDILSLVLLAVLTGIIETGSFPGWGGLGLLVLRVSLFFAIAFVLGKWVFPRAGRWITKLKADELEFSGLLVAALAYAWLAEYLGLHFIVGAFLAGLFMGRQTMGRKRYGEIKAKITGLTNGFLGPIFFASIGLHLDASAFTVVPVWVVVLVVVAFVTKLIGAGVPAYIVGLDRKDALAVGCGMSARGAVELIIADVALRAGLFDHPEPVPDLIAYLFSAVVIMAIATTLATPIALQLIYRKRDTS